VLKQAAWLLAGAVIATAGAAHAQQAPETALTAPSVGAPAAAVPWYQRFTTSNGLTESITGDGENDRIMPPAWTLNQRWGVTLDVREARRIERAPEGGRGDQTAVGAYYQFTPRMRVGGELSVEAPRLGVAAPVTEREEEPRAGVRLESAFRF